MTNEHALAQGQRNIRAALRADNLPAVTLVSAGPIPTTQFRAWTSQCGMPSCVPKYGGWHCLVSLGCPEPEERVRRFRKHGRHRHGPRTTWTLMADEDKSCCSPPWSRMMENNGGALNSYYWVELGEFPRDESHKLEYNEGSAAQLSRRPGSCRGA